MSEKTATSTDVGTRLLFENDRVKVWDLRLAPGERTGFHRHEHDYFFVVVRDGELAAIGAHGEQRYATPMHDGEVRFRTVDGEDVHDALNVGTGEWRNIVVELKD